MPRVDEVCDEADNDCDGHVDEGVLNACGDCGELPSETLLRSRERSSTAGSEGASQNGYRVGGPVS
jgi:hypothetical protein